MTYVPASASTVTVPVAVHSTLPSAYLHDGYKDTLVQKVEFMPCSQAFTAHV